MRLTTVDIRREDYERNWKIVVSRVSEIRWRRSRRRDEEWRKKIPIVENSLKMKQGEDGCFLVGNVVCVCVCLRRRSIQPLTFRVFAVCVELTSFYICFCTDVEYFLFVFFLSLTGLPLHLLDSLSPPDIFLSPSSATHIQCTHENKEKGNEVFTESTLCVCQVEERSSWRQGPRVLPLPFSFYLNLLSFWLCL